MQHPGMKAAATSRGWVKGKPALVDGPVVKNAEAEFIYQASPLENCTAASVITSLMQSTGDVLTRFAQCVDFRPCWIPID